MRRTLIFAMLIMLGCIAGCTPVDNLNSTSITNTNTNANRAAAPATSPVTTTTATRDDRTFAMEVAQNSMAEIALARLATQKGQNAELKRFAQRMVTDHSKAAEELKQLATTKGITLPADMKPDQRSTVARFNSLSGAEFDREFMTLMAENHDKSVEMFQAEARDGTDPEIKAWASKLLPTLQEHQKMAHDIHTKVAS